MSRDEQGCRAGRRPPRDERLAAKDQWRRKHQAEQQKTIPNWH